MLRVINKVKMPRAVDTAKGNVQTFLERLLVEVAAGNYRHFLHEYVVLAGAAKPSPQPQYGCWPPLLAQERQVSGLFAGALSSVCPVSRPEEAIRRIAARGDDDAAAESKSAVDSSGRIDFMALYASRHIGLEIKRHPISSATDREHLEGLKTKWNAVSKQAKQVLGHMRDIEDVYSNPVTVGLLVIRVSRKVRAGADLETARVEAVSEMTSTVELVKKTLKPRFLAVYKPPVEMQSFLGWGENGDEFRVFPGVIFAAAVHARQSNR